jgi:hypothetical protein
MKTSDPMDEKEKGLTFPSTTPSLSGAEEILKFGDNGLAPDFIRVVVQERISLGDGGCGGMWGVSSEAFQYRDFRCAYLVLGHERSGSIESRLRYVAKTAEYFNASYPWVQVVVEANDDVIRRVMQYTTIFSCERVRGTFHDMAAVLRLRTAVVSTMKRDTLLLRDDEVV